MRPVVGVKVGWLEPERAHGLDLRSEFRLHFFDVGGLKEVVETVVAKEVPRLVEQSPNLLRRRQRTPAVVPVLGHDGQVHRERNLGMPAQKLGRMQAPGRRRHQRARAHETLGY